MAITDEIPKSRLTLTYRTNVNGEPEEVQLPLRLLIMGDLSKGTSKDVRDAKGERIDLDKRSLRQLDGKNLDKIMADMNMSIKVEVPNKIDPDRGGDQIEATLPIKSMKSFQPAEVAKHVPKIRALLLLRKLLLEVQANIDNRKEFRLLLREMAQHPEKATALLQELPGFEDFKVPAASVAALKATHAKP
jgi:type VI secretion system protein ImpB